MAAKHHYEVVVGDESVYRSTYHETSVGKRQAVSTYNEFVKKSKEGIGWAAGQDVILLQDEKPVRKFVGWHTMNPRRKRNPGAYDAGYKYVVSKKGKKMDLAKAADSYLSKHDMLGSYGLGKSMVLFGAARDRAQAAAKARDEFLDGAQKAIDDAINANPPRNKFIRCKAVKFNRDGSVSIKK